MAVDVKVSIKGTWLFNEDFPQPSNAGAREVVDFFVTINGVVHQGSAFSYDGAHWVYTTDIGDVFAYTFGEGWNKDLGEDIRRVTFAEGEDVRESFVQWMKRCAKPEFATVAYKGEALATVFGEQTVTLKCEGMKMEGDLEIRAAECGYTEGYETGKKTEWDAFWDGYQERGNRTQYAYAFYLWPDEAYNPKYPIKLYTNNAYAMFTYSKIKDTRVDIDISQSSNTTQIFSMNESLVTIRKLIVSEKTILGGNNLFYYCKALENVVFEGVIGSNVDLQWPTKLTKASITNIINTLSTTKSGLTVTLSKVAVDNAFATSAGAANGSTSEEWLNLIATKNNWTISLV